MNGWVLYFLYVNLCIILYFLLSLINLIIVKYLRILKFYLCGFGVEIPKEPKTFD